MQWYALCFIRWGGIEAAFCTSASSIRVSIVGDFFRKPGLPCWIGVWFYYPVPQYE